MLSRVALAYYASAGDDEISTSVLPSFDRPRHHYGRSAEPADAIAKIANNEVYQKVHFRPRILRKVAEADASTKIVGKDSKIPVFIAPAYVASKEGDRFPLAEMAN
jgi:isopentenyl diphosphate isomerase/L-lactate dehydrogenase-like FMN-dependent dehydrogenase